MNFHTSRREVNLTRSLKGFTLVEMLVSIFVFTVIMFISSGAILSVMSANRKNQADKVVFSNFSFALETVARELRQGYSYASAAAATNLPGGAISSGGIAFQSNTSGAASHVAFYHITNTTDKYLVRCEGNTSFALSGCNISSNSTRVTGKDVSLDTFSFSISPDTRFVRLNLIGSASLGTGTNAIRTNFSLQTSVTTRRVGN